MSDREKLDQNDEELDVELEKAEEIEEVEESAPAVYSRYPEKDREKQEKEKDSKDKKKVKKEFFLKRFGKWIAKKFRELGAELRKVTWPTFPKVVKQTGIVISVVVFFLVIVFAIDLGLSQLYKIFIDAINS